MCPRPPNRNQKCNSNASKSNSTLHEGLGRPTDQTQRFCFFSVSLLKINQPKRPLFSVVTSSGSGLSTTETCCWAGRFQGHFRILLRCHSCLEQMAQIEIYHVFTAGAPLSDAYPNIPQWKSDKPMQLWMDGHLYEWDFEEKNPFLRIHRCKMQSGPAKLTE